MAERGSKEQHLATALEVLDELGPPGAAQLFSSQGLAESAGVHRATLYRYWESTGALNDDLARWGAMERFGWQRRILAEDPAQPFDVALHSALRAVTNEFSIGVRAAMVGFLDHPSSRDAIAWERRWLDALGEWIALHLHLHGRRPLSGCTPFDIAMAVACAVEGPLVLGALYGGPLLEGWTPEQTDLIVVSAERIVMWLSESGRSDPVAPDAPAALTGIVGWSDAKRSLVARLADKVNSAEFGTTGSPEAARMVDFRVLSRRTGVSARRLYAIWPAPEDFNADLVELVMVRHREDGEANASEALTLGLEQPGIDVSGLMLAMAEGIVLGGARHGHSSPFGCVSAMSHPVARARGIAVIDDSIQRQKVGALAMLQTFGYDILPPLDADQFIVVQFGAIVGAQRLALSHPELRDRTIEPRTGGQISSLAVCLAHTLLAGTIRR